MSEPKHFTSSMSKHRIDALTDGIFAVAMTLLVIELKLPESHLRDSATLLNGMMHLISKFAGWIISFFVLALFWYGHHRVFHFVHRVDGKLIALNLLFLSFASFMPFASAVAGDYVATIAGQVIYSSTMILLACTALLIWRYVYRHPALCNHPMPEGVYRSARFRNCLLMVISIVAVIITILRPGLGNTAFLLMLLAGPVSRRIESKYPGIPASTS